MIIWFLWFTVVAWTTSHCEPPVNSYLPPGSGLGRDNRPSQEYGQPGAGNQERGSGLDRAGARHQPQDSYSPIGQQPPAPPSSQYGTPENAGGSQRGFGLPSPKQNQGFGRPNTPDQQYGAPNQFNVNQKNYQDIISPNNQESSELSSSRNSFGLNNFGAKQRPDSIYGPPNNQDRAPNERNRGFGNQGSENSFSSSQRGQQSGNRESFQQPQSSYGPPAAGNPLDNDSFRKTQRTSNQPTQSSYSSPKRDENRSNNQRPSTSYGTPQVGEPSGSFGDITGGESNEPAKYEFNYDVDDSQTGTLFGHSEQRDGDTAMGMYNVVLPDGRKQVVEYEAGRQGYKPQIRYEGGRKRGQGPNVGSDGGQGGNQGYPRSGPNSYQRDIGNTPGNYQTEQDIPGQQQRPSFGTESGYPRGGSRDSGDNDLVLENGGYPRQQNQPSSGINRGPNVDSGYSRDLPQGGRQFNYEDSPGSDAGYSRNTQGGQSQQGLGNSDRGYPSNQNDHNIGGRVSQRGDDFGTSDNEGYSRGGPSSRGGSNSPAGGGGAGEAGYPARGPPAGPRGSGY